MAITFVSSSENSIFVSGVGPYTAEPVASRTLTINAPASLQQNDVMVAVFTIPLWMLKPQEIISVVPPSGWDSIDLSGISTGYGRIMAFVRLAGASEPASYDFVSDGDSPPGGSAQGRFDFGVDVYGTILAYRGVDILTAVNNASINSSGQDPLELTTTKDGCLIIQAGHAYEATGGAGSGTPTLTLDAGVTQRSSDTPTQAYKYSDVKQNRDGLTKVGDDSRATAGTYAADYSGSAVITIALIALQSEAARNEEAPPAPGQVGVTASGSITYESDIISPLGLEVWEGSGGSLAIASDSDQYPEIIGVEAAFNGIGACKRGSVYFISDPFLTPYSKVLRLRVTDGANDDYWFAGIAKDALYENGLYRVDLVGVLELLIEAAIGSSTIPALAGVIADSLNLNSGAPIAVAAGTAEEYQTWRNYLGRKFALFPEVAYGVGADLVYAQGRPREGGFVTLDALDYRVLGLQASEYILPPYVSDYYLDESPIVTGSRSLGLLVPKRVEQASRDASNDIVSPDGYNYPITAGQSHSFMLPAILIPPVNVINLPGGISQYVASSTVTVSIGEEGSVPQVQSKVTTVALPYTRGR